LIVWGIKNLKKFCAIFILVVFYSSFIFSGPHSRRWRRISGAQGRGVCYVMAEGRERRFGKSITWNNFEQLQRVYRYATRALLKKEEFDSQLFVFEDLLVMVIGDFNDSWSGVKCYSYNALKKNYLGFFSNKPGERLIINFTAEYCKSFCGRCVGIDCQLDSVSLCLDDLAKKDRLDKIRRLNDMLYKAIKGIANLKGFDLGLDVSSIEQRLQNKSRPAINQFVLLDGYEADREGEYSDS
jgi:hypothetical protein